MWVSVQGRELLNEPVNAVTIGQSTRDLNHSLKQSKNRPSSYQDSEK